MLDRLRAKRGGARPVARVRRQRHFEVSCFEAYPGTPIRAATAPDFARAHGARLQPLLEAAIQTGLLAFAPERIGRFRRYLAGSTNSEAGRDPTGTYAKWAAAGVDPDRWNLGPKLSEHDFIPLTPTQLADWPLCWWAASEDSGVAVLLTLPAAWFSAGGYFAATYDPGCAAGELSKRTRAVLDHARNVTARRSNIGVFYDVHLRLSLVGSGPLLGQVFQVAASTCGISRSQWPRYAASGPPPIDAS